MRHAQLQTLLAETVGPADAEELAAVLGPLTELVPSAPVASAELRALFDAGCAGSLDEATADDCVSRRSRGARTLAGVVVLTLSGVGATGLSAAANTLPGPLQHQVSRFSAHYLPFQFPDPKATAPRDVRSASDALGVPAAGPRHGLELHREATAQAVWRAVRLVRSEAAGPWADSDPARGQGADRREGASAYSKPSGAQTSNAEPEQTTVPRDARSTSGSGQVSDDDDARASPSKGNDREPEQEGNREENSGTSVDGQRSSPREPPRHPSAVASSMGEDKFGDRDKDPARTGSGIDQDAEDPGRGAPNDRVPGDVAQSSDPVPVGDARGQEEAPAPDLGDLPLG